MKLNRFAQYAWLVLAYNIGVILWGAYVRASGSGAGCGNHWPLCNGEVIPRAPEVKTLIEFSHRLTSGLALLLVVGMAAWAWRKYPPRNRVRRAAAGSLFFMLAEALVGAGLVLFELVADNASIARAIWMSAHLVNTLMLLGAMTLTAWWASGGAPVHLKGQSTVGWVFGLSLLGSVILGMSGAVTALGDTLVPGRTLAEALEQNLSPTILLLLRLRILHPALAIMVVSFSLLAAYLALTKRAGLWTQRFAWAFVALSLIQLGAGLLNVSLRAPIWMQIVHLLLADLMWIVLLLLAAATFARAEPQGEAQGSQALVAGAEELRGVASGS